MTALAPLALLLPIASLLVLGSFPGGKFGNSALTRIVWIRRTTAALLAMSVTAGPLLGLDNRPLVQLQLGDVTIDLLYWNGVALLMLMLVSFIGFVVAKFSMRQLADDPDRVVYYCRFAWTLAGISLAVVAGNLLVMFGGWLLANASLGRLLAHYRDHSQAAVGARMKRGVDGLAAMLLAAAMVLVYQQFGTLNLADFSPGATGPAAAEAGGSAASWIAWLLALSATLISVQFPFHSWLPETLAAPTPVSALMHAGIVNAGGFFLIRLNGLVAVAPSALTMLVVAGSVTLLLGGLAMLAQTSVKRTLAYSTIAQMGFMMLQCGMGAWTAAMMHIVAHSLYKAYAFLSSGDALVTARSAEPVHRREPESKLSELPRVALAVAIVLACFFVVSTAAGLSPADKPGGFLLAAVLCMALLRRTWGLLEEDPRGMTAIAAATTLGLLTIYVIAYAMFEIVVGGAAPALAKAPQTAALSLGVACALAGLLGWELLLTRRQPGPIASALYVHAVNGFYVDAVARRAWRSLAS